MAQLLFPIINFFIFIGILVYVLKKPLKQFLENRSLDVEKTIQEATQAHERAQHLQEEAQKKLNHLEDEKKSLLSQSEHDEEHLNKKSKEALETMIGKMKAEYELRLEEELRKATENLRKQTIQKVIEDTQAQICENLKTKNQESLIEENLENLKNYSQTPQKGGAWSKKV